MPTVCYKLEKIPLGLSVVQGEQACWDWSTLWVGLAA